MQIVRTSEELAGALAELKREGTLALVPTMGALHAGHMALIAEAKSRAAKVVATIFVNPRQFGAGEDLDRYPRREPEDAQMLEEAGCDLLWAPAAAEVYPPGFSTSISVAAVSERWEGESRPGHFDGVATVVARLLLAIRPEVALFGEKDFQQLAVIRRMVRDLAIPVEIAGVETVREQDGVALSSRNAYLSDEDRSRAVGLYRALRNARTSILAGQPVGAALGEARNALLVAGFSSIDYVALVDERTLEPLDSAAEGARLIGAASIGTTRLIDNLAL